MMKPELLSRLRDLSETQIYNELYRDHLTGVLNRRAFELESTPWVAIADLDSLKYVNDTLGHRWGDHQLVTLAAGLVTKFGHDHVYRLAGDEFAVTSVDPLRLTKCLLELQSEFPAFTFGIGSSLQQADKHMVTSSTYREYQGLRASRGERPWWFNRLEAEVKSA